MAEKIESFCDLVVYQKAFSLQQIIFEITKHFIRHQINGSRNLTGRAGSTE
jgi:hypothetical protein